MGKTGVDLPGEAATIMHKKENVGQVELATMSFGQSFQVTPMQMATTVCSLVNGGKGSLLILALPFMMRKVERKKKRFLMEKENGFFLKKRQKR